MIAGSPGPPTKPTKEPDPSSNASLPRAWHRDFSRFQRLPRSPFRRLLLDSQLLLRCKPRFQMLTPLAIEILKNNARHSLRVDPRHLPFSLNPYSQRQFEREIDDRGMPERFGGPHGHSSFAQIARPGMMFRFPILQNHGKIHGMPDVSPPLALQQLFCDGDMQRDAVFLQRLS